MQDYQPVISVCAVIIAAVLRRKLAERRERMAEQIIGAEKAAPHADRLWPGSVERQRLPISSSGIERGAVFAVELVDKRG